jgi:uncharacterized protein DUF3467
MDQNNPQPQSNQQNKQIQVKVNDEVLKGVYANMVQVSHGQEEFILDFMNIFPPQGIIASRVIISPAHMKRLVAAMQENLKRYETQYGKVTEGSNPQANFGFRTE